MKEMQILIAILIIAVLALGFCFMQQNARMTENNKTYNEKLKNLESSFKYRKLWINQLDADIKQSNRMITNLIVTVADNFEENQTNLDQLQKVKTSREEVNLILEQKVLMYIEADKLEER